MGTNYYACRNSLNSKCPCCEQEIPDDKLHIGKSSAGWYFALRIHSDRGILSWDSWTAFIVHNNWKIFSEYGDELTLGALMSIIFNRGSLKIPYLCEHDPYTEIGINNLLRPKIDGLRVLSYGEDGPYYLVQGEFS